MAATHEGTCPVCFHTQKIVGGGMAKHGYQRRWGREMGQCLGTDRVPFELSPEGTKWWAEEIARYIANHQRSIESLKDGSTKSVWVQTALGNSREVAEGSDAWAGAKERELYRLRREISEMQNDLSQLHGRIVNWTPKALREVTPTERPKLPFAVEEGATVRVRERRSGMGRFTTEAWNGTAWVKVAREALRGVALEWVRGS